MDVHTKVAREIEEVRANLQHMEDLAAGSGDEVEVSMAEIAVDQYEEELRELLDTWNIITR